MPSVNEKGVVTSSPHMRACARNISLQKLSPKLFQKKKISPDRWHRHCFFSSTQVFVSSAKRVHLQPRNVLVSGGKVLISSTMNKVVFYLEVDLESWFGNPPKHIETREKVSPKPHLKKGSFQVQMDLKKVQKQGRDEFISALFVYFLKNTRRLPTSGVHFFRCWVVFLRSFISALFLYFFRSIST